ncbi:MAG: aconitate hydratase AcnA [Nitrososphaerota archaeon]|nr:aconitate hydratase AcnA [Candidatus Calditenuaceae archaeon]MDW8073298.1 aconitate hydratase AcnA [Nitrososphaerota archaeon]
MNSRGELREVRKTLQTPHGDAIYYDLHMLEEIGLARNVDEMPLSLKILLENVARSADNGLASIEDVELVGRATTGEGLEIPFMPSRALLQDFTGVPLVVDLAAMREVVAAFSGNPDRVNPEIPTHLVVDHSIQVDYYASKDAFWKNLSLEFLRNRERYILLKWAQGAFRNFYVVPPGRGIVHQVNLESLARVVEVRKGPRGLVAFPDTVLGTDSHTPMVNGLGVLGWGVGGIEAEAVMLGQPYYMPIPEVVGVKLVGELQPPATATDLVLTITEVLRKRGVVGKFVEFFGPGVATLTIPDRATVSNMAPEYGATIGLFPIDSATLKYLQTTGREEAHVKLIKHYAEIQGLYTTSYDQEARYGDVLLINLSEVEPSIAGPANPEDRIRLREVKEAVLKILRKVKPAAGVSENRLSVWHDDGGPAGQRPLGGVGAGLGGEEYEVRDGSVVIAAITSCTNTSNPAVMIGAGLLARNAVQRGLRRRPYVKTSLAPGSAVVIDYLEESGLLAYLSELGFDVVGYGCTTCIGNSGPLQPEVEEAIRKKDLFAVAVLSGNRNFEGRIHPSVKASFLASPILVVAYAIAGRIDIDFNNEPLGRGRDGRPVFLKDIWPDQSEIRRIMEDEIRAEMFRKRYGEIFTGVGEWEELKPASTPTFSWDPSSTYIRKPPYFEEFQREPAPLTDILGARALVLLGDRVTTDHISPAGAIPPNSPAGLYLRSLGVDPTEFNTYGSRRGNHEVMIRGTFANHRLRNHLLPDGEGWWTIHFPDGDKMTVYEAAMRYKSEGVPLIVLAGKQYGAGSSRDWAAKGTRLLGVRAVIAESFERIHRSNLVGMGVLPLQFKEGEGWRQLGLTGSETYDIKLGQLHPKKTVEVIAKRDDGAATSFETIIRLDTSTEIEYYRHGGILPYVVRRIIGSS